MNLFDAARRSEIPVSALPAAQEREGAERIVNDVLPMLKNAIAVGGGKARARVRSDGYHWRVLEWLDK